MSQSSEMKRRLKRQLGFWERGAPWFVLGLLGVVSLLAAAAFAIVGAFGLSTILRGFTELGLVLGVLSSLLALVTFLYSARKRSRAAKPSGTVSAWLWSHVCLGVLAFLTAALHAGYGAIDLNISTGMVLFWLFALLTVSGIAWRLVYQTVPVQAEKEVKNYSQAGSAAKAQRYLQEIENLSAGGSKQLIALKNKLLEGRDVSRSSAAELGAEEQTLYKQMKELAEKRLEAQELPAKQASYTRTLQGWRFIHIPLGLLFVLLLVLHVGDVLFSYGGRLVEVQTVGFAPAKSCASCHQEIYEQWRHSMHAHALTSPVTVAQTNLVVKNKTFNGGELVCNNCHGPVGVKLTEAKQPGLLFTASNAERQQALNEGITCVTCHQYQGSSTSSGAGGEQFQKGLTFADAVFGYHHKDKKSDAEAEAICENCHDVNVDRDRDGTIQQPQDLVLQTTFEEYKQYKAKPTNSKSCLDCHMAPSGTQRDHSFVGVDYPLDVPGSQDPHRAKRVELLQKSAGLEVSAPQRNGDRLNFSISIENREEETGHNLPSGFAFARQLWLEVRLLDSAGGLVASSGLIQGSNSDLCDKETMKGALAGKVVGCTSPDVQLVSFQKKLLDENEQETALQYFGGKVVARKRNGEDILPIKPGEKKTFAYEFSGISGGELNLHVALKFRNLPPYFLRELSIPENLIKNLDIVTVQEKQNITVR